MLISKDAILGALLNLSQAELATVHATAGQLLARTGAGDQGPGEVGQPLYDALVAALGVPRPYSTVATDLVRRFKQNTTQMVTFLDTNFNGWSNNKITQLAFLRMLFDLIVSDLKNRGVTPTLGIVIVNMNRVSEVFDNAFPGYLAAGLGPVILKGFQNDTPSHQAPVASGNKAKVRKRLSSMG